MADILIRGMEMPTQCGNCPISTNTRRCTILWREFGDPSERLEDCPLVPLPEKHGRLIDADACHSPEDLNNEPTIVPAEGGADDEHI